MEVIVRWVNWMAWLVAMVEGEREKEREMGAAGGLGSSSPWRDAIGKIIETHAQALAERHACFRPAWPAWPQCPK